MEKELIQELRKLKEMYEEKIEEAQSIPHYEDQDSYDCMAFAYEEIVLDLVHLIERAKGGDMNLENFNSELRKRLDDLETEKQNRGAAIIDQLINDIQENDWYCIQSGSESNLHGWEKALIVAGLESLMEGKK